MYNEENLVLENTENVEEQTTEETVEGTAAATETTEQAEEKLYTEAELNERVDQLLSKKLARKEAKIRKEYDEKLSNYKEAELVLNAGLGTKNIAEATNNLKSFYKEKGVEIPEYHYTDYNDDDMKVLASNEAQKIIESGFDEVVEEVDRLADKGLDNMTQRERLVFTELAEYRKSETEKKELAKIGVSEKALQDSDFIEFAKDLNPSLSMKEKYEKYLKYRPKSDIEQMGSMKNSTTEAGVKDFYTREEALKFTRKDLDKNPALFKAIENSMPKW